MQARIDTLKKDIERLKSALATFESTLDDLDKDNKRDYAKVIKCIKDKIETEALLNSLYMLLEEENRSTVDPANNPKTEYDRKSKTYSIIRNSYKKLTDN